MKMKYCLITQLLLPGNYTKNMKAFLLQNLVSGTSIFQSKDTTFTNSFTTIEQTCCVVDQCESDNASISILLYGFDLYLSLVTHFEPELPIFLNNHIISLKFECKYPKYPEHHKH